MGRNLTFLNTMYTMVFFIDIFIGYFGTYFLFKVGFSNFSVDSTPFASILYDCKNFLTIWLANGSFKVIFHVGMMFCRFIYARYATGLVTEGMRLFHGLVFVFIGIFSLQLLLIWPIQYTFFVKEYPLNMIKGKICTQTNIVEFDEEKSNVDFSIKPKILIITLTSLYWLVSNFFTISAHKQSKKHRIPKTRRNLMEMRSQNIYMGFLAFNIFIDQIGNMFLQIFYNELGVQNVFKIWWIIRLLENLVFRVIANSLILHNSRKNFEEFNGYNARTFPGQEQPRPIIVCPRRDQTSSAIIKKFYTNLVVEGKAHPRTIIVIVEPYNSPEHEHTYHSGDDEHSPGNDNHGQDYHNITNQRKQRNQINIHMPSTSRQRFPSHP